MMDAAERERVLKNKNGGGRIPAAANDSGRVYFNPTR
jgi:hypothetical protein